MSSIHLKYISCIINEVTYAYVGLCFGIADYGYCDNHFPHLFKNHPINISRFINLSRNGDKVRRSRILLWFSI